jgi:hypothetical protein
MRAVTVVGNGPQFVKAAPPSVALQEAGIAEVLVHTGFQPDPGLGGHRIPIDPFYLTWKAREFDFQTRFIELAGEINQNMPYDCRRRSNHGAQKSSRARTATLHPATPGARARTSLDDVPADSARRGRVATPVPTHCALAKRALEARKRVSLRHRRNLGVAHVGDLAGREAEDGRGGAVVTKDVPSRGRRRERGAGDPPGARRRVARRVGLPRSRCPRFGLRKSTLPIRVSGSSARNSIARGHDD